MFLTSVGTVSFRTSNTSPKSRNLSRDKPLEQLCRHMLTRRWPPHVAGVGLSIQNKIRLAAKVASVLDCGNSESLNAALISGMLSSNSLPAKLTASNRKLTVVEVTFEISFEDISLPFSLQIGLLISSSPLAETTEGRERTSRVFTAVSRRPETFTLGLAKKGPGQC